MLKASESIKVLPEHLGATRQQHGCTLRNCIVTIATSLYLGHTNREFVIFLKVENKTGNKNSDNEMSDMYKLETYV